MIDELCWISKRSDRPLLTNSTLKESLLKGYSGSDNHSYGLLINIAYWYIFS